MISALNRFENGTVELTITIPWQRVKANYDKTLAEITKTAEIKGFRKGKAPKNLVEKQLGKQTIHEKLLQGLVSEVYIEAIKEQKIQPILNPEIKVISLEENKPWQIKAITCEMPQVKLGDYQTEIKKTLAAEKIWVPGKDKEDDQAKKLTEEQKMAKVFSSLVKTVQIKIPAILIENEANRTLSRLIDQTGRLGLTVDQYLQSIGKTSEQIRSEYQKQAEETLKLEFVLSAIADQEKITISDAEVKKMIQAAPDEKTRKNLETPTQKAYLRQLLRKRQVIDRLSKL